MSEDTSHTENLQESREQRLAMVRVTLRPMGTPMPLGLLGLAVATTGFSGLQLGIVPENEANIIALAALVVAAPLQMLAAVFGVLARDPVAGTAMGVLGATWALLGVATLITPPAASSTALGFLLLVAGVAVLVPITAALSKIVVAIVMIGSGLRFALSGIAEITGAGLAEQIAGIAGLVLAVLALYAATALEIEDVENRTVLPLLRRGPGRLATEDNIAEQLTGVGREAGVRQQL